MKISKLDFLLNLLKAFQMLLDYTSLRKKLSFLLKISSPQETTDLVTFTEEILNGKLHSFCSVFCWKDIRKLTVTTISFVTKSCLFKRLFGKFGLGISESASPLESVLASTLQKFYFCLQKFFLKKWSIFIVLCLVMVSAPLGYK